MALVDRYPCQSMTDKEAIGPYAHILASTTSSESNSFKRRCIVVFLILAVRRGCLRSVSVRALVFITEINTRMNLKLTFVCFIKYNSPSCTCLYYKTQMDQSNNRIPSDPSKNLIRFYNNFYDSDEFLK